MNSRRKSKETKGVHLRRDVAKDDKLQKVLGLKIG